MKWYTACLVFEVKNHHHSECSFFEESWITINADSIDTAKQKAHFNGAQCEESFSNQNGDLIEWRFLGFRHVREFNAACDGEELVSISTKQAGFTEEYLLTANRQRIA